MKVLRITYKDRLGGKSKSLNLKSPIADLTKEKVEEVATYLLENKIFQFMYEGDFQLRRAAVVGDFYRWSGAAKPDDHPCRSVDRGYAVLDRAPDLPYSGDDPSCG